MVERLKSLVAWVQALKPVRVFQNYSSKRGPILASGLAYQALFAIFAAIWVAFSVLGLVLSGDPVLTQTLVNALGSAVPGLIDSGDGSGAIKPDDLLQSATFSWTGIIALLATLLTALGFMGSTREAMRSIFDLPPATGNPVLVKAKDFAALIGLAVLLVVSTTLSIAGTAAMSYVLGLVGIPQDSVVAAVLGRIVALALAIGIYAVIIGLLLTVVAGTKLRFGQVWQAALIGAAGVEALTVLFQLGILGGASNNPLLASFVVILGLLVFFNFICQVMLISASWAAIGLKDADERAAGRRGSRMPASRAAGDRPLRVRARARATEPTAEPASLWQRWRSRVSRRS